MPTINISQALRERDESLKNTGAFSESRAPVPNIHISGALAERERRAEKPRENAFLERAPQAQNAAARTEGKSNADKLQGLFAGENLRTGENAGGLQMPKGLQNYPSINQDYAQNLMSRGGGGQAYDGPVSEKDGMTDILSSAAHGFGYGLERTAAGALGGVEFLTDALTTPVWWALGKVTSSNLLEPITGQGGEENAVSKFFTGLAEANLAGSPTRMYEENIEKRYRPSDRQRMVGNVGGAIGGMLPAMATGSAVSGLAKSGITEGAKLAQKIGPYASKMVFGLGAAGGGMNEAYQEGASVEQALIYGAEAGALEVAIESIAGGIPGMPDGMGTELVKRITGSPMASRMLDILGEGGEEALSAVVTPYLKQAVYDPNAANASIEEIADAAVTGMLVSGFLQAPEMVESAISRHVGQQVSDTQVGSGQQTAAEKRSLPRLSMEDFQNPDSPVWTNVDYNDEKTKAEITQRVASEMLDAGQVVELTEADLSKFAENFPDLRGMKKKERTPILRQAVAKAKNYLRDMLERDFKGKPIEFEVNGNVLEARLYDAGIREVLDHLSQEKTAMLDKSGEIFAKAKYLYSTQDKAQNNKVLRWNYFYVPLKIDSDTVGVRIAIRDIADAAESQIYNWGIKKRSNLPNGPVGEPRLSDGTAVASSDPSVAETTPEVNNSISMGGGNNSPFGPGTVGVGNAGVDDNLPGPYNQGGGENDGRQGESQENPGDGTELRRDSSGRTGEAAERRSKEASGAFLARVGETAKKIREVNGTIYAYREVPRTEISPKAQEILRILSGYGLDAVVLDGPLEAHRNGWTSRGGQEASTGLDGTIYLQNQPSFPADIIAHHEKIHAAERLDPQSYDMYYERVMEGNLNPFSDSFKNMVEDIASTYFDSNFDYMRDYKALNREFLAFLSGEYAHDPVRTHDVFGPMFLDWSAFERAYQEFDAALKQRGQAASFGPGTVGVGNAGVDDNLPGPYNQGGGEKDGRQGESQENPGDGTGIHGEPRGTETLARRKAETTGEFFERIRAEEKTAYRVGNTIYAFRETSPNNYSPQVKQAIAILDEYGIRSIVISSPLEGNSRGVTGRGGTEASTAGDGSVFINNGLMLPADTTAHHEKVHAARRIAPDLFDKYYSTVIDQNLVVLHPSTMALIRDIIDMHFGPNFDYTTNYEQVHREILAYLSGEYAHDPTAAKEFFGPMFSDWSAFERAYQEFDAALKQRGQAASFGPNTVGAAESAFPRRTRTSQFRSNTVENTPMFTEAERAMLSSDFFQYNVVGERQSMAEARQRLDTDFDGEVRDLPEKAYFDGTDVDTAMGIAERFGAEAAGAGPNSPEAERFVKWVKTTQERMTDAGQAIQALAKYTRTAEGAAVKAQQVVDRVRRDLIKERPNQAKQLAKSMELSTAEMMDIYSFHKKAMEYPEGSYERAMWCAKADKIVGNKIPKTFKDQFITYLMDSMLGNFRTLISRNAGGNLMFAIPETIKQYPAAGLDALVSLATGTRTRTAPNAEKLAAYLNGLKTGAREAWTDYREGVSTQSGNYIPDVEVGARMNAKAFSDGTFIGHLANEADRLVGAMLSLGDRPFFQAAYNQRMVELRQIKEMAMLGGKVDGQVFDESNFDALAPVLAKMDALEATFQNKGIMPEAFRALKTGVDKVGEAMTGVGIAGQFSMPFTNTTGNLFVRNIEYTPFGAVKNAVKTAKELHQGTFDQRRFVDETARNLVGSALFFAAGALFKAGFITGDLDDDKDKRAAQYAVGMQPNAIKIGDSYYSYDWIPVLGPSLSAGAAFAKAWEDEDNPLLSGVGAAFRTAMETSALQGLTRMLGGQNLASSVADTMLGGTSQAVPSIVRQVTNATDQYQRQTYDPNPVKDQMNYVASSIPGLRQLLPIKTDTSGRPVEQNQGRGTASRLFENLISPGKLTTLRDDPVYDEAFRLSETIDGDLKNVAFPRVAEKTYEGVDGKRKFTAEEYNAYSQKLGELQYSAAEALIRSPLYQNLSDEEKAKVLQDIYGQAAAAAKKDVLGDKYSVAQSYQKALEAMDHGIPLEKYNLVAAIDDADGNGSVSKKEYENALKRVGLTASERSYLLALRFPKR